MAARGSSEHISGRGSEKWLDSGYIFCKQKQQNLPAGWKGNIKERSQGGLQGF